VLMDVSVTKVNKASFQGGQRGPSGERGNSSGGILRRHFGLSAQEFNCSPGQTSLSALVASITADGCGAR